MAWIRQLPSGVWAATVYTPAGRRTESDRLKGIVENWAGDLEASIRQGQFLDPALAKKTVGMAWEKFEPSRRIEMATRKRDRSTWKVWVEPRWGSVPSGAILKPDVQTWVNELEADKVGGWTIIAALNVLKSALELAVDAGWIRANPARRVKPPMPPAHVDRVILPHEETILLDRLDELFPGRRDARLFVEGMLETGARWEEVAAVKRNAVDLRNGLIDIGPVMERDGTIRDYPKGARTRHDAAFRPTPVGDAYLARLKPVVLDTKPGGLIYTAPMGGPMLYPTWLRRLWNPVMRVPVVGDDGEPTGEWTPLLEEPMPTPHDCRHTYGTRLADAGVPQHDRMALMGHKDVRSAQRYTHSGETRFDAARNALKRARQG